MRRLLTGHFVEGADVSNLLVSVSDHGCGWAWYTLHPLGGGYPFKLEMGARAGVTAEQLMTVLLDYIERKDAELPCDENKAALAAMAEAREALMSRTRRRLLGKA